MSFALCPAPLLSEASLLVSGPSERASPGEVLLRPACCWQIERPLSCLGKGVVAGSDIAFGVDFISLQDGSVTDC